MTDKRKQSIVSRRLAADANRRFRMMSVTDHHLIIIKDLDKRKKASQDGLLVEKIRCTKCGVLNEAVQWFKQYPCGTTMTSSIRSISYRKELIKTYEDQLSSMSMQKVKHPQSDERYGAVREAWIHLKDTLDIPSHKEEPLTHDMMRILVPLPDRTNPTEQAICRRCKTMAVDVRSGRTMKLQTCRGGEQMNGSHKARLKLIALIGKATIGATGAALVEYNKTLDALQGGPTRPLTNLGQGPNNDCHTRTGSCASRTVPTTPSRKARRVSGTNKMSPCSF
jgi:hypothetical protein